MELRISKGSSSREFIRENFCGRQLHDTVYLTANPYVGLVNPDVFHAVITLMDEWDSELETVPPWTVVDRARRVYEDYPEKRLIFHFMQPHIPYIGEKADELKAKLTEADKEWKGWDPKLREVAHGSDNNIAEDMRPPVDTGTHAENFPSDGMKIIKAPERSDVDITKRDIWEAYCETLDITLDHVGELLSTLDSKTVISSDHGELIGETPLLLQKQAYGHPGGFWVRQLRQVPWFVTESQDRRQTTSAPPDRYDTVDDIEEKLAALGYR